MQRAWRGLQREKVEEEVGGEVESGDTGGSGTGYHPEQQGLARDQGMGQHPGGLG